MSEIVAGFTRRLDTLKTSREVGQLFIRKAAMEVIKAEGVVRIATSEWRNIAENADMMTPQLIAAAKNKVIRVHIFDKKDFLSAKLFFGCKKHCLLKIYIFF